MGEFIHSELDGYQYLSDNGILYDLFEGTEICGPGTSDIVFIMVAAPTVDTDQMFVGWLYGASMFDGAAPYREDLEKRIVAMITEYEAEHSEITRNCGMIKQIQNTVEAYLRSNREVLSRSGVVLLEKQIEFLEKF